MSTVFCIQSSKRPEDKHRVVSEHTQGLENEYDRLLASHDELQRRLSRLDQGASDRTFGSESKTD